MATREEYWLRQVKRDLEHARHALEDGDYECGDKIHQLRS